MRGGNQFKKRLAEIAKQAKSAKVRVGIIKSGTYDGENGESVAQVAFWNEYGTATSPSRPFFRNTIAAHKNEWPKQVAKKLADNNGDVHQTLNEMGEYVQGQIIQTIQNFEDPPNAASTIKKKGFNSPLRDTGALWQKYINYEVTEE